MPRNMSFMLTTEQAWRREKIVTRRIGWQFIMPGDIIQQVEKAQGLKKGEKVVRIHQVRVVSTRWEPLNRITDDFQYGVIECIKEGFPGMLPGEFVAMFCKANRCSEDVNVNRIRIDYV